MDPVTRGTVDRRTEPRGLGAPTSVEWAPRGPTVATNAGLSLGPLYTGSWAEMAFQAAMMGFTVTGRNETKGHNPKSRHYVGEAIDVRTRGHTNAEVNAFISFMRSQGYIVRDERIRPAGQKVWSGPHVHVEAFDWAGLADALSPVSEVR